jgi:hypothetical protein
MSEEAASNSGEEKQPVNSTVATDSDFLAKRISQLEAKTQAKAEVPTEDAAEKKDGGETEVKEVAKNEEAKTETKAESTDVLSKIDFDTLSEAEIMELAGKSRSKAIARYGELTADKKALQQQIAQLQAQLQQNQKPALDVAPTVPKEYASIDKVEALQEKLVEAKATMEWAEAQLDQAEHLGANETIQTEHGTFTKSKLKELFRLSRKAKDEWIPAQYANLQTKSQRAALREAFAQQAKQELKWMEGEDNDVRKQYEALVKSPLVKKLKEAVPEIEPDLEYIIGHAVNSIHGRKYHTLTEDTKKTSVTLTSNSAVKQAASGGDELHTKAIRELERKVHSTGSDEDFLALRTKQLARKRIN